MAKSFATAFSSISIIGVNGRFFAFQVNLVDWLNVMVSNHQLEEVVDPNLKEKPSLQELKKIVDIALKCVDQEAERRPKMSQVIQMLESDDNVL